MATVRPLLLGLDVGSTRVKGVVFDLRGRVHSSHGLRVPVRCPRPGWVERGAEITWKTVLAVLRKLERLQDVVAVGITGCGNGAVFLDSRGKPLRAGILSSDRRAAPFVSGRKDSSSEAYAGQLGPLLRWFRREEKAAARRLAHALFWKDFVRYRLTGQLATDPTDAGAAGLLPRGERHWRNVPDPAIPPIRESLALAGIIGESAARVTGLRSGTPVITGCLDCEAAAIGSGTSRAGDISIVAGTWSINQTFVTKLPDAGNLFLMNPSVQPGRWLLLEGSPSSAANFDWAVRTLVGRDRFAQALRLAERATVDGLLFLPGVSTGQGAFFGLDIRHERGALLRAVLEGVAFAHRRHLGKLMAAGVRMKRVRLAGGAAQSPVWCQVFADALDRVVECPSGGETGALGAAICAGVGAGLWPSVRAAQRDMTTVSASYRPGARAVVTLERAYARFVELVSLFS